MMNNILTKGIATSTAIALIAISFIGVSMSAHANTDDGSYNSVPYMNWEGVEIELKTNAVNVNPGDKFTMQLHILNNSVTAAENIYAKMSTQHNPHNVAYVPGSTTASRLPLETNTARDQNDNFGMQKTKKIISSLNPGGGVAVQWDMMIPNDAVRKQFTQVAATVEVELMVNGQKRKNTVTVYKNLYVLPDPSTIQNSISIRHEEVSKQGGVVAPGEALTYQTVITNTGNILVEDIDVRISVPNGRNNQLVTLVPGTGTITINDVTNPIADDVLQALFNGGEYRLEALNPRGASEGGTQAVIQYDVVVNPDNIQNETVLQSIAQAYSFANKICDTQAELLEQCTAAADVTVHVPGAPAPDVTPGTTDAPTGQPTELPRTGAPIGAIALWLTAATGLASGAFVVGRKMIK